MAPFTRLLISVTTTTAPPTTVRHTTHPTTTTPTTTPTPTTSAPDVNCVDNLGGGLRCEQLPGVCNDAYSQVVCRRACGFCTPAPGAPTPPEEPMTLDECKDNVMNGLSCNMLPGVCEDTYGQIYCRKSCGNCTAPNPYAPSTTPDGTEMSLDDCVDNLMYGFHCSTVPGVCSSQYGQIYCRRFCNTCHKPNPYAPTTPPVTTEVMTLNECKDNVVNGLTCGSLPGVCNDVYGQIYCRKSCGNCTVTSTTVKPTTHPHTASPSAATTTTASTVETCIDNLGGGLMCQQLPGVCNDQYSRVVCRRSCGFCTPNPNAATTPSSGTEEPMTLDECKDNVMYGLSCNMLPAVCEDTYGQIYCRKSCGNCTVTTTTKKPTTHIHTTHKSTTTPTPTTSPTTTMSSAPCIDNLGGGLRCEHLPDVCTDLYAQVVCRKTCQFCVPNPNEATTPQSGTEQAMTLDECKDNVMYGLECNMLPGVCGDPYGQIYCRKTCGNCTVTTAPPPTTTPTAPTTTKRPEPCEDHIGNGLYCDQLPDVCADQWAQIVCRRTCNFCTPTPYDSTSTRRAPNPSEPSSLDCADHLDSKFDCSELPNVCLDEYGKIFCRKTCGGCQCEDKIQGLTCQDLVDNFGMDPCKDALGDEVCPRFLRILQL
ncbi:hypothetical protein BaRGS_00018302, partial [Batillaria attramentaria]